MGLRFRGLIGPKIGAVGVPVVADQGNDAEKQAAQAGDKETDPGVTSTAGADESSDSNSGEVKELQFGVQAAEATLQVWTKNHLIAAYIL